MLDGSPIDGGRMELSGKAAMTVMGALVTALVASFLKNAWDDAQKQAYEAANPRVRWTDAARWEK